VQPTPEKESFYSPKAKSLCQKLMESEYSKIKLDEELCKELHDINVISCEDDYYSVNGNNKFSTLFVVLSIGGRGKTSLWHSLGIRIRSVPNMATDIELTGFIENQSIDKKYAEKLKKNRRKLRSWFNRFVESVLLYTGLPNSPSPTEKKPDKTMARRKRTLLRLKRCKRKRRRTWVTRRSASRSMKRPKTLMLTTDTGDDSSNEMDVDEPEAFSFPFLKSAEATSQSFSRGCE
jgi:hypothetical protein